MKSLKNRVIPLGISLCLAGLTIPAAESIGIKGGPLVRSATLAHVHSHMTIDELDDRLGLSGFHATDGIHSAMTEALSLGPVFLVHQGPNVAVLPQSLVVGSQAVILRTDGFGSPKKILLTREMVERLDKHLTEANIGLAQQVLANGFDGAGSGSTSGNAGSNNGFGQVVLILRASELTGPGNVQDKVANFVKSIGYSLVRSQVIAKGQVVLLYIQVPAGQEQAIAEKIKKKHPDLVHFAERDPDFSSKPNLKKSAPKVSAETKKNITRMFNARRAYGFSQTRWQSPLPQDLGFVRVPLPKQMFDGYQYAALILTSQRNQDPNQARYFILERFGGLAANSDYSETLAIPRSEEEILRSSVLRHKVEIIRASWREENTTNGVVDALSGRLKVDGSALSREQLKAAARALLKKEFKLSQGVELEARVDSRLVSPQREAVDKTTRNIAEGLFNLNPRSPDRKRLGRQITAIAAHVENPGDVIAVSADAKVVIAGIGDGPLNVRLILFINGKTGEYAAFYSRESTGEPRAGKQKPSK